jgi:hypothetical protein
MHRVAIPLSVVAVVLADHEAVVGLVKEAQR